MKRIQAQRRAAYVLTPITLACSLVACGGDTSDPVTTYAGKVVAASFKADASGNPKLTAGYYQGATVFIDANGNGVQDAGEPGATTDANGNFTLTAAASLTGQLVANIPTTATNTAAGAAVPAHLILRASAAQIADQGNAKIVISALSTEVQRLVEANGTAYATERANIAARLTGPAFSKGSATVAAADVVADVNTLTNAAEQYALLYDSNTLASRYTYATAKLDRGDKYPDALAVAGGDPRLASLSGISKGESIPADTRTTITYAQSQQAAFNIEGVPAYDNIFIIMEENKSTDAILGNTANAPYMNQLLNKYNQLTTYYSTGVPSEPNYTALGGGDDFGITDDNWFGCGATGATTPKDVAFAGGTASDGQPLPATGALPPTDSAHLAGYSTTAGAACSLTPTSGTSHNALGDNLFTLLSKAGLTARTYSESMNPGQDPRSDSVADAAVVDTYNETDIDGATVTGTTNYPLVGGLYKVKHGPSIAYQSARLLPEFHADNRTIFGTQYTAADWAKTTAYTVPTGWMYDQFSADLAAGDVGNINFIVPDQCDDMHGVGSDASCQNTNNSGFGPGIKRADIYLNKVVTAIQKSALWTNPNKRVAIVVMFDEGEGSSTSCCGWNAGGSNSTANPVAVSASGVVTATATLAGYSKGNLGHGNSIFTVITNQQDVGTAAKGVKDSDAYSHFSFVRTLQDMFGLADPAVDATYLNRAKYTEAFVAANITSLPEFAGSADTHFDSVRPINHAYKIPTSYVQKLNPADIAPLAASAVPVQTGPDATQANVWSLK
jgi:hypothetical protein